MTIDAPLDARPAAVPPAAVNSLLTSPILPTLLKLALPNTIAMFGTTLVAVAETSYIGRLGTEPLAGIALVFPFVMLTQMMSAGAMGGGVSSAISRALGAGNRDRAATLALHAAMIGDLRRAVLHGDDADVRPRTSIRCSAGAAACSNRPCTIRTCCSPARSRSGWSTRWPRWCAAPATCAIPSVTLIGTALVQIAVGGALGLGLFGLPRLGMQGVAAGQLTAFTLGAAFLAWYLLSGHSRLTLNFKGFQFQRDMFLDILKVGAVSCLSPLQTVLTVLIFTKILASYGTETLAGYGMGSRLEFLLTPIAFAFGVASVPMVGMAMGAGLVTRARQVAWIAGAAAGITVGLIGLIVAIMPSLWVSLFTSDPGVTAAASAYLSWAGPAFAFFGLGACLYFSSQGAAKVVGPVMAGTARLLLVGGGGWWLARSGAPAWTMFALVGAAMIVYGLGTALSIRLTRWGK